MTQSALVTELLEGEVTRLREALTVKERRERVANDSLKIIRNVLSNASHHGPVGEGRCEECAREWPCHVEQGRVIAERALIDLGVM